MTKHTPGPWEVVGGTIIQTADERRKWVAEVPAASSIHETFITDRANARLIAAAPELLEACEFALEELNDMTSMQFAHGADKEARQRLENAIAKAKGGDA